MTPVPGPEGTLAYALPMDPRGHDPAQIERLLGQVESHATRLRASMLLHYVADHFPEGAHELSLLAYRDDVHDEPFLELKAYAFAVEPAGSKEGFPLRDDVPLPAQWVIDLRRACLDTSTPALETVLINICKGRFLTPQGWRDLARSLWSDQEWSMGQAGTLDTRLPAVQGVVPRPRM